MILGQEARRNLSIKLEKTFSTILRLSKYKIAARVPVEKMERTNRALKKERNGTRTRPEQLGDLQFRRSRKRNTYLQWISGCRATAK